MASGGRLVSGSLGNTKTVTLSNGDALILEFYGKYVDTASVLQYVLIYSVFMALILILCCMGLWYIRYFYRRKTEELMAALEAAHRKQLKEAAGPSPFAVEPITPDTPVPPKEVERVAVAPSLLASILHHAQPNDSHLAALQEADPHLLLGDVGRVALPAVESGGFGKDSFAKDSEFTNNVAGSRMV